jgi:hypothetical protein
MKKAITAICLFLASATAFAQEQTVQITCNAGNLLSVQGVLENDVFTGTVIVSVGGTQVLSLDNLKYKKTQNPGEYYDLVKDEVASQAKYDDIYFIPDLLNLSTTQKSQVLFWLPTTDDRGENSPILLKVRSH